MGKIYFLVLLFGCTAVLQAQENILPAPLRVELPENKKIVPAKSFTAKILPELEKETGREGYFLETDSEGNVTASAASETGIFYARQTLAQLHEKGGIPAGLKIFDKPRFAWRAFMLDEARHFFGIDTVKALLDQMAQVKMNVFHWHLTDDSGWRIEIKKYPKLTQIGGFRRDSQTGTWSSKTFAGKPHGGFYTQEQIQEIVKYAADRHIIVVPEIDIPGHSAAACVAYPELKLTLKQPREVPTRFGDSTVLDPSNEGVYKFFDDIFSEIIPLFPAKIIHFGGDEVRYKYCWKNQHKIADFMAAKKLGSFVDLHVYFSSRMSEILRGKGAKVIGWTEVLGADFHKDEGGSLSAGTKLDRSIIVQNWDWRSETGEIVKDALRARQKMINSSSRFAYLDYSYEKISLKKAYEFEPIPAGLEPEFCDNVIGIDATLWTEWVPNVERLYWQAFPRLLAHAETAWTPREAKNWENFYKKVRDYHLGRLKSQGVGFCADALTIQP